MESVLERIDKNHFFKIPGGIHPPEQKFLTNAKPIKHIGLPDELIIPIQQHIGKLGDILVKEGDYVLKGQPLTACTAPMTVPVHASTSGTITAIKPSTIAHPSGMAEPCIFLKPDGQDTWRERVHVADFNRLTKKEIVEKIANAGISGMGGAGFPTNVKVNTIHAIKYLIINAVECEPYITADDLLVRERTQKIIDGINILKHLLEPEVILIGIEDNKPQAIEALKEATKGFARIKVCVLPTKYPTGGEKQLIQTLTGNELPSGVLPVSLGIITQNVATVFAIAEAIIDDKPLIERVVTVTGQALQEPQNVWARLGTPVQFLLDQCGFEYTPKQRVIMGGPLMGFTLPHTNVPIVKISNCILVPTNKEISPASKELECIRCGQCAEACPASLLPQELQWYAKANDYENLDKLNLFDCIECGACAYVCPSHIPLVKYYRVAKSQIRFNIVQEQKAERAKLRFEARKVRLEKEKQAREAKHQQALAARKAAAKANPEQNQATNSAVAAAMARVKAKKAAQAKGESPATDAKSIAAQAIARAKAKKAAQNEAAQTGSLTTNDLGADPKTLAAQAIARAKAKKAAQQPIQNAQPENESSIESKPISKDDRVAQAVARAKAKKAAQQTQASETEAPSKEDRVAQAVAKAKAKKAAQHTQTSETEAPNKEDRVAQAVAKAKAKKAAQHTQASEIEAPSKEDRVAQAVAKAKAKKAAQQTQASEIEAPSKEDRVAQAVAKAKAKKAAQQTQASEIEAPSKEDRVAQAVAKAKAKKAAQQTQASEIEAPSKEDRVARAVAKAKAKKAAQQSHTALQSHTAQPSVITESAIDIENQPLEETLSLKEDTQQPMNNAPVDDKKARIAAAIAKAKAKKAQQQTDESQPNPTPISEITEPKPSLADAEKKQKIAAAIAKAKARKQQENK